MASNVSVVNATAKSIGDVGTARDGDGGRDGEQQNADHSPANGCQVGAGEGLATVADART